MHLPDGYTLLWVTQTNAINTTLYNTLNFNFGSDIQPVAGILHVPAVVMVNPSVPAKTIPEFIAYAKANPGKVNMSSPGIGSINHVAGEMFKRLSLRQGCAARIATPATRMPAIIPKNIASKNGIDRLNRRRINGSFRAGC